MGKRQSKMQTNGNAQASRRQVKMAKTPDNYILLIKSDTCGACTRMQSLFDELKSQGSLHVDPLFIKIADKDDPIKHEYTWETVLANPIYGKLVRQAYGFHGREPGSVPLLMGVRRGRVVRRDTQLGTFPDADALKMFLSRF
jgi:hypothetical protein